MIKGVPTSQDMLFFFLLSEEKCATLRMFEDELSGGWPLPMESWPLCSDTIMKLEGKDCCAEKEPGERRQNWQRDFFHCWPEDFWGSLWKMQQNGKIPFLSPSCYGCELVVSLARGRRQLTLSTFYGVLWIKPWCKNDPRGCTGAEKVLLVLVWWAFCPVTPGWLSLKQWRERRSCHS